MATAGDDLLKITLDGKTFYCTEEVGDRIEEDPEYASEFYSKISQYSKDVIDLPDGVYLENEVPVHEPEVKKPANRSTIIYVENEVPVHEPEVKKPASRSTIIERAPKTWTTKETDALISLRIEKDDVFKQNKTHTTLWNSISNDMEKQGYIGVTSQQCSNKWKSLKRSYMETIDHNTKTGEAPKSCKYYSELNQLFGNKPSTKPDFTLHSSESSDCSTSSSNKKAAQRLVSENKHQSKSCSDASGSDDNEFNVVAPKKKKKIVGREKRKSPSIIDFLTEYKEEQKEDRKKHEDILERHHQEKMKRFDRYLDILEDKRN